MCLQKNKHNFYYFFVPFISFSNSTWSSFKDSPLVLITFLFLLVWKKNKKKMSFTVYTVWNKKNLIVFSIQTNFNYFLLIFFNLLSSCWNSLKYSAGASLLWEPLLLFGKKRKSDTSETLLYCFLNNLKHYNLCGIENFAFYSLLNDLLEPKVDIDAVLFLHFILLFGNSMTKILTWQKVLLNQIFVYSLYLIHWIMLFIIKISRNNGQKK